MESASASWRWSPRASPSRRGRGCPNPGATATTAVRASSPTTSNSCRSLTAAWWMWPARPQQLRRAFELLPAPAVRKITRGHDELGLEPVDEPLQRALDVRLLMCICVEVGNMEEPGIHDRTRL